MTVTPILVNTEHDKRWDEYVLMHPQGSIYHHSVWRQVLLSTYGYDACYIALENKDTGQFEGILPLMLLKSKVLGNRLVSLPFTSYCCLQIPENSLEDVVAFVIKNHPGIKFLELKFLEPVKNAPECLEKQSGYVTHILELDQDLEVLFRSFHITSIRQRIKRAEKNHVTVRMAENEGDLHKFYHLHSTVRKKHGLPPHPYAFFANMWDIMRPGKFLFVPLLEHQGEIIAGAFVFKFKDTFHYEYSAADQNQLKIAPNQKLIWEVIKMAVGEGAKFFDFGRSSLTNPSLIEFKERWGAKRQSLAYYYYPKTNKLDSENGLAHKILTFTNRLLPISLLQLEGRIIYPHLG